MRGIRRENARPGVGAIRTQSRESRNPERGRAVKIGFLDTDKVNIIDKNKCSSSVLLAWKSTAFYWRTMRESGGGEKAGGVEGQPGTRRSIEEAEKEETEWEKGG